VKPPAMRPACGTVRGLQSHQAAGERACGECLYADAVRRIAAEGVPARPTPPGWLAPVTAGQARENAAVLDAEVAEYERDFLVPRRNQRSQQPRRHLKPVA
jgi:hypothetical protein